MRYLLSTMVVVLIGCSQPAHLRRDEQVVFFPTIGYPTENGDEWVLPVHGWVYEESWLSQNLELAGHIINLEKILGSPVDRERLYERLSPFVVNNQEGRRLHIVIGERRFPLSPAGANGHFHDEIRLPADELAGVPASAGAGRMVTYRALCADDERECMGTVYLPSREGLTIVSDIDDTIRITEVNNTRRMLGNTFVHPLRAVPGMARLYCDWVSGQDACVCYLSAAPAQLSRPLTDFLTSSGFPPGSLALRSVEWKGDFVERVFELFDAPPEYKVGELAALMRGLPNRQYVLVGDSGQSDPEIYGAVARAFPAQVQLILIRDVTCCEGRDSARYQAAFRDLPDSMWVLFRDPDTIRPLVNGNFPRRGRETKPEEPLWRDVLVRQLAAYN